MKTQNFVNGIATNWMSTVAGAVLAGLVSIQNYQEGGDWKGYLIAFAIAFLGVVTRDWNKSSEESNAKK